MELILLLLVASAGLGSARDAPPNHVLHTLSEGELKNSQLWRQQQQTLYIVKQGS